MFIKAGVTIPVLSGLCYLLLQRSTKFVVSFIVFIIGIGMGFNWKKIQINRYFDKNGNPKKLKLNFNYLCQNLKSFYDPIHDRVREVRSATSFKENYH
ncbi:MAG: hypothetical protein ACI815_000266 [Psychroserpens sp.]|jgi:hypothetical protein